MTTAATADLLPIVLGDAARIQEEDAAYKKRRHAKEGRRGPYEEIPLYTTDDVERTLALIEVIPYERIRKRRRGALGPVPRRGAHPGIGHDRGPVGEGK